MASTPPNQIRTEVHTPPTPLHGAAHDNLESPARRHSARLSQRRTRKESHSTPEEQHSIPRKSRTSIGTPTRSQRTSTSDLRTTNSPRATPKHRPARRVQVLSPSPDLESPVPKPITSSHLHPSIYSSTTTMSDGMLPTPIKTPKKKTVPKVNGAARALFQDQPVPGEEVAPLKRARKQRRYNGFSLESFHADDTTQRGQIQIFTDSRDQVPEAVTAEDNPFAEVQSDGEHAPIKKVASGTKRRKVTGEHKRDLQVQEAIDRDDGMVYVFRGKKVYRRFDDMDDEEEEIDTEDLGLLGHVADGAGRLPMKTLTRKSIKPKRLFQKEEQNKASEAEKEREVSTDVEEQIAQVDGLAKNDGVEVVDLVSPTESGRTLRSPKKAMNSPTGRKASAVAKAKEHDAKNGSPFTTWKRVKSGQGSGTSTSHKATKRKAPEMEEGTLSQRVRTE